MSSIVMESDLVPYEAAPLPPGPYLVFAPHPDDETLGMGGTIALAAAAGIGVTVVFVTAGDKGGDPGVRVRELEAAAKCLGIHAVFHLMLHDREVFHESLPEAYLRDIVHTVDAATIFLPSFQEIHPDHRATTAKILPFLDRNVIASPCHTFPSLWFYEINRQGEINRLIDISSVMEIKRRAIACYDSQLQQLDYAAQALAMDLARSITLGEGGSHAEGFWCHEPSSKAHFGHQGWADSAEAHYFRSMERYRSGVRSTALLETAASQKVPSISPVVIIIPLMNEHETSCPFSPSPFMETEAGGEVCGQEMLTETVDSVLGQTDPHWHLVFYGDDSLHGKMVRPLLKKGKKGGFFGSKRGRIGSLAFVDRKKRDLEGYVEKTSARMVMLMNAGDTLSPAALHRLNAWLSAHPDADLVYSDEDTIDSNGRRYDPFFKPDWSPDLLISCMYIGRFCAVRPDLFLTAAADLTGWHHDSDPAWEYDLILKVTEDAKRIDHIPEVLYHRRDLSRPSVDVVNRSAFDWDSGKRTLERALKRRGIDGTVSKGLFERAFRVTPSWDRTDDTHHISIVIPFKDGIEVLDRCIQSILEKTVLPSGSTYDVLCVNNQSCRDETFLWINRMKRLYCKRSWPDAMPATPKHKNSEGYFHGKQSWPNGISATPENENRICFHGKPSWPDTISATPDYGNNEGDFHGKERSKYAEHLSFWDYDHPFNYAALNNAAIEETSGDLLLFLNSDTEVISPGWLTAMMAEALKPQVGAVGAKLIYPDDTIQHAGIVLGRVAGLAGHAFKHVDRFDSAYYFGFPSMVRNVIGVTGACMMVKRSLFQAVGGFDEALFKVAYNDVDLCLKLLEKGYQNVYTPFAELYHHESYTRKDPFDYAVAETLRMKWQQYIDQDPYYNINLTTVREDWSLSAPYPTH